MLKVNGTQQQMPLCQTSGKKEPLLSCLDKLVRSIVEPIFLFIKEIIDSIKTMLVAWDEKIYLFLHPTNYPQSDLFERKYMKNLNLFLDPHTYCAFDDVYQKIRRDEVELRCIRLNRAIEQFDAFVIKRPDLLRLFMQVIRNSKPMRYHHFKSFEDSPERKLENNRLNLESAMDNRASFVEKHKEITKCFRRHLKTPEEAEFHHLLVELRLDFWI